MASYKNTLKFLLKYYRSIFPTEREALEQLFFVNGNGYDWENGELTSGQSFSEIRDEIRLSLSHDKESEKLDTALENTRQVVEDMREMWEKQKENAPKGGINLYDEVLEVFVKNDNPKLEYNKKLYPLCEYADILHIPDNVKPDWLEAAEKALEIALTYERTDKDDEWLEIARKKVAEVKDIQYDLKYPEHAKLRAATNNGELKTVNHFLDWLADNQIINLVDLGKDAEEIMFDYFEIDPDQYRKEDFAFVQEILNKSKNK